jgi:phospholipid/cholesterol/gamma-HCH transport system substrate-binding protein
MDVFDDAGPLYRDAGAVLRWKTVLGGEFYVDLDRGDRSSGELGSAAIPASRTDRQVELDDITTVDRGAAQQGLKTLPGELSKALADHQAPGRLLGAVADVSPDVEQGVGALRGEVPDEDLRGLVEQTSRTVRALDRPDDAVRRLVAGAAATLRTTGARGADISRTIARSPAVMDDASTTLTRLQGTLRLANPLLADLRTPAGQVAPTLRELHPTVTGADKLLKRAEPLLRSLRPAASALASASKSGLPLVDQLVPSLDRLDQTILPMLSEKDPDTTKSTAVMIGGTFEGLAAGAGGQMDVNGHFIRFPATTGNSPLYSLPCQTYIANPDKAQLVACKSLQDALKTYMSWSPLGPTPGTEPAGGASTRTKR